MSKHPHPRLMMNRRELLAHAFQAAGLLACSGKKPLMAQITPPSGAARNVRDLGARGDGVTLDTAAFQRTVDLCSAAGGGTVHVPAGSFVLGTLLLKSGVTLELSPEAVLLGSLNPADYFTVDAFVDAIGARRGYALLAAVDQQDIRIVGNGAIDGRGQQLQDGHDGADSKPFLIRWVRCQKIEVTDVTLRNAAAWTMHCFQSSHLLYRNLHINSFGCENNDGLDIDSSEHVAVENCVIESQDDAICLKSTSVQACRFVAVSDCTMRTHHGALKIGTESMGDIQDVSFLRCHVIDAREGALKITSEDGANVQRITASDIRVDIADTPIFLRLGSRLRRYRPDDPARPLGSMRDITVRNFRVADATRVGVLIMGVKDGLIADVTLDDIRIKLKGEINQAAEGELRLAEQEKAYPEVWMFGPLIPAYGLFSRHAAGLTLKNIDIQVELPDQRPAVVLEDVSRSSMERLALTGNPHSCWIAGLRDCRAVRIAGVETNETAAVFARIDGSRSAQIQLGSLALPNVPRLTLLGADVSRAAVRASRA